MKNFKKIFFTIGLFFVALNVGAANNCQEHNMHGFAWSDGAGWISFDCKSANSDINYGVDVDKNGYLSGYAWSDSIGWISFDYYGGSDTAKYNKTTKKLEGYVKALAGLDDPNDKWNGKISLSGTSSNGSSYAPEYNQGSLEFDKYAWGGQNVGWIDFKTNYGIVTMDPFYFSFSANKGTDNNPVDYNGPVILSWITDNAFSCTSSDGAGTSWTNNTTKPVGSPNAASETIEHLEQDILFSLTCSDNQGHNLKKSLEVKVAPPPPEAFLFVDDDNIPYNTSTPIHWNIKHVKNCKASSSSGTWDKNLDSSDGEHTDSTGNLTASSNWFKIKCDAQDSDYYPDGIEKIVYVDVEKLTVEFYPEENPVKFNDKIKLYWKTEFANSCTASGDLTEFNGDRDHSEGLHDFEKDSKETTEGKLYDVVLECDGREGQHIKKELFIKVGNNPVYEEI